MTTKLLKLISILAFVLGFNVLGGAAFGADGHKHHHGKADTSQQADHHEGHHDGTCPDDGCCDDCDCCDDGNCPDGGCCCCSDGTCPDDGCCDDCDCCDDGTCPDDGCCDHDAQT